MAEIIVVDDQSTDRTADVVRSLVMSRLRVLPGASTSSGWLCKSWALEQGLREAKTEWVLCLDADTRPYAGLAAAVLQAALLDHAHAVSVAPRFIVETAGERWLHPALLTTLIYRLGPADVRETMNTRRMVNGQCFLFQTSALRKVGGFTHAKAAFANDFALAAHLIRRGLTASFRNGAKLLEVKMYRSLRETWREWGRSLGLKSQGIAANHRHSHPDLVSGGSHADVGGLTSSRRIHRRLRSTSWSQHRLAPCAFCFSQRYCLFI